jgi:hypothetical protein
MPIKNIVISVIIIATSAVVLTNSVEYAVIRGEGSICQRFGKREADCSRSRWQMGFQK